MLFAAFAVSSKGSALASRFCITDLRRSAIPVMQKLKNLHRTFQEKLPELYQHFYHNHYCPFYSKHEQKKEADIMKTANRKRNRSITIRLSAAEYDALQDRIYESGLNQQTFIINASLGAPIASADQISELKQISRILADLVSQLRGIGTNINQMAHVANGIGILPTELDLRQISVQVNRFKKEGEEIWQSIRSLISLQKATGP